MFTISIVIANQHRCSGVCSFCHGKNEELKMGVDRTNLVTSLKKIDEETNKDAQFDFDALEKAIIKHPKFQTDNKIAFSIWGTDPLTSFINFQEIYDFIQYIKNKYNKDIKVHASTNGLPFTRNDIKDWILKNDVWLQLSHDGLGEYFRAFDIDPLEFENTKELIDNDKIGVIACLLNQWNALPIDNADFFNKKLHKRVNVRLAFPHFGEYSGLELNRSGLLNGKNYDNLKDYPFGDYLIRNDIEGALKTGVAQLAHQCDDHFNQLEIIIKTIEDPRWGLIRKSLIKRMAESYYLRLDKSTGKHMFDCTKFNYGLQNYSGIIDTLGRDTGCHLIDGSEKVENPTLLLPDICNSCEFKNFRECGGCAKMHSLPKNYVCQYNYRWNQFCLTNVECNKNVKKYIEVYKFFKKRNNQ